MQKVINRVKGKLFNRKEAKFSFAQAGEDLILSRIFLGIASGFYVDVGAYHPYRLSNTYLFYLNGWRGINIEPRPNSKSLFDKFRPNDINLEIGIAERSGTAVYSLFEEDTLNQFRFSDFVSAESKGRQTIEVKVEPLSKVFQAHIKRGHIIDFMTVDTEGAEYQVLKSNNWLDFPIKVILLEQNSNNRRFEEVSELLRNHGYVETYRIPVNAEADSVFYISKQF